MSKAAEGRVKAIFQRALEADTASRSGYLDRACEGDEDLRARVDTMLAAYDEAGDFLADASPGEDGSEEAPGATIDRYKLLQKIGEGGFGVVYMAEQNEPVRRRVALKVLKPGMDSGQVIARFEAERQALAMMEHPNIAGVLDAGTTKAGRPYFVMELVRGVEITAYCNEAKMNTAERIDLFRLVCSAVQHAHMKGVVHRDIKPSNVLVTMHDGVPVPKVIDFGIAKATDQRLTEKTLFTELHQMIGTPEYMAPEQAEFSGLDVDTRADIYSLGVLLYELLTGTKAFDLKPLLRVGFAAVIKHIREVDPPRPSDRMSTMASERLETVAKQRRTAPASLGSTLKGDLDWIVMRALEKDRTRRYETASAFALDLQRFREDEPVAARPPSARYRLGKYYRRHRVGVFAAAAVCAALVAGVVLSSLGYLEADRQLELTKQARDATKGALKKLEASSHEIRLERDEKVAALKASEKALLRSRVFSLVAASAEAEEVDSMRSLLLAQEAVRLRQDQATLTRLRAALRPPLETAILRGHRSYVTAVDWSADGSRIVTSGIDMTARVWDTNGRELAVLRGHKQRLNSVAFSADGSRILTSAGDGTARLWSTAGEELASYQGDLYSVSFAVFSPDESLILTAGTQGAARLWTPDGQEVCTMQGHGKAHIWSARFSPDGKKIVTAGWDNTACIWSSDGRQLARLRGHTQPLLGAAFSPDGKRVVTSSRDETARIWSLDGQELSVLRGHEGLVWVATFSPDGTRILTADTDKTARLWTADGVALRTLRGHKAGLTSASYSPDGSRILTTSWDKTARLWDVDGHPIAVLRGHEGGLTCAAFSPTGSHVLTGSGGDATARIWDVARAESAILRGHRRAVLAASFSPTGPHVLTGGADGTARIWSADGKDVALLGARTTIPLRARTTLVASASYSPDGKRILTGSSVAEDFTGDVRLWDATGAEVPSHFADERPLGRVHCALFSPDGSRILTADENYGGTVWDDAGTVLVRLRVPSYTSKGIRRRGKVWRITASAERILTYDSSGIHLWDADGVLLKLLDVGPSLRSLRNVEFSPSGSHFATASTYGPPLLWDSEGKQIAALRGHSAGVSHASFSPDGSRVVTASDDGTARLWDRTGACRATLEGHLEEVTRARFSPDGTQIVTVSADNTARLWDATGKPLAALHGHAGAVLAASFSPDGSRVVTASKDGTARLWLARTKDVLELADRLCIRDFTPKERERYADVLGDDRDR